jgi:hypothetical protein
MAVSYNRPPGTGMKLFRINSNDPFARHKGLLILP